MVDGQVRGGFAQAIGAALYEEYAYAPDGSFLTGTFADYLLPTVAEVPEPVILHMQTPSPFTPLGSKGVGEGNCMSTPACIANAVADALNIETIELPLGACAPGRKCCVGDETPAPAGRKTQQAPKGDRKLVGEGTASVAASPEKIWKMLLDPANAASRHSRLPRRQENIGHAFPRRRDHRRRPGQGPLSRHRDVVRSR